MYPKLDPFNFSLDLLIASIDPFVSDLFRWFQIWYLNSYSVVSDHCLHVLLCWPSSFPTYRAKAGFTEAVRLTSWAPSLTNSRLTSPRLRGGRRTPGLKALSCKTTSVSLDISVVLAPVLPTGCVNHLRKLLCDLCRKADTVEYFCTYSEVWGLNSQSFTG